MVICRYNNSSRDIVAVNMSSADTKYDSWWLVVWPGMSNAGLEGSTVRECPRASDCWHGLSRVKRMMKGGLEARSHKVGKECQYCGGKECRCAVSISCPAVAARSFNLLPRP